ncbi:MAG: hypothetical protein NE334_08480 [Lentisphaeraceae bacterium]|nr:hypothetical protein [Lentisphaeraceae bacterium]
MQYNIDFDSKLNSFISESSGPLTRDGISTLLDDLIERFAAHESASYIANHGNSPAKDLSADDIWKIAEDCKRLSPVLEDKKLAVVFYEDLDYGLGRMWQSFTETKTSYKIELFRSLEDAKVWISKAED